MATLTEQLNSIEQTIQAFAGTEIAQKVIKDQKQPTADSGAEEIALWVKNAMARLESLVDEEKRIQIMQSCGQNCATVNKAVIEQAKARRNKFPDLDEFLEQELKSPTPGTRLVRNGDILIQYYTPKTFSPPMRCYCSLMRGLPENEKVSLTYCHCATGFVHKYWETVLGKSVEVELKQSVLSGADECEFMIYLTKA